MIKHADGGMVAETVAESLEWAGREDIDPAQMLDGPEMELAIGLLSVRSIAPLAMIKVLALHCGRCLYACLASGLHESNGRTVTKEDVRLVLAAFVEKGFTDAKKRHAEILAEDVPLGRNAKES